MADKQLPVRDRLEPNRVIFRVTLAFLTMGMLVNVVQNNINTWQVSLMINGLTVLGYGLLALLEGWRRLRSGPALVLAFSLTVASFVTSILAGNYGQPGHRFAWVANPQLTLVLGMFVAISGMAVNKLAAVFFGSLFIMVEIWFAIAFTNSRFYQDQLPMNVCVIIGCVVMIWYYRSKLEDLVFDLDGRLLTVRKLKERVEAINEQNRPFVVFGRNTSGLVADFATRVDELDAGLAQLRQARGSGQEAEAEQVLSRMDASLKDLNRRIEWVMYVASATAERQEEEIDLQQLVDSALYPFRILPEYRETVDFRLAEMRGIRVRAQRRQTLQWIEQLVRTGCDAGATVINLEILHSSEGDILEMSYRDNAEALEPVRFPVGRLLMDGEP